MEKVQELFFKVPKVAQDFLRDVKGAKRDDGAQEGNVGGRIRRALECRQVKTLLQAGQVNRRAVQFLGHVAEGDHGIRM